MELARGAPYCMDLGRRSSVALRRGARGRRPAPLHRTSLHPACMLLLRNLASCACPEGAQLFAGCCGLTDSTAGSLLSSVSGNMISKLKKGQKGKSGCCSPQIVPTALALSASCEAENSSGEQGVGGGPQEWPAASRAMVCRDG